MDMGGTDCKQISKATQKKYELARIRTWNLLIRSQTRYPLRHETKLQYSERCETFTKINKRFLSVVVITHPSHG